jgi:non-ribosomal peptide synthetase component F
MLDPRLFSELLEKHRITVLWLTSGLFLQYAEALSAAFGQLRYLITGGDIADPVAIERVRRDSPPGRLLNAYGPTECTTFSTMYPIEALNEGLRSLPIGSPISNTQVYVLDNRLQPVTRTPVFIRLATWGDGVRTESLNTWGVTIIR